MRLCRLALLLILAAMLEGRPAAAQSPIFTADSLKSGRAKDVFTSFFQLALQNIAGPEKEFRFHSNPFAVMLRSDRSLAIDSNWIKYRRLRALNFSVALKTDSNFRFAGFAGGLRYALVNKRDVTVMKAFVKAMATSAEGERWRSLNRELDLIMSTIQDEALRARYSEARTKLTSEEGYAFKDLPADIKALIRSAAAARGYTVLLGMINGYPNVSWRSALSTDYEAAKEEAQRAPLWTISADGGTNATGSLASAVAASQFLWGFAANRNNTKVFELDLRSSVTWSDDSLRPDSRLDKALFLFEPGVNLSFRTRGTGRSFFEMKLAASYIRPLLGQGTSNTNDSTTVSGELRLRVFDDIWIPVTIRYAPQTGSVQGFLNISANFTALSGLLGGRE